MKKTSSAFATCAFIIVLLFSSFAAASELPQTVDAVKLSPWQTFLKDTFSGSKPFTITSESYPTTVNKGTAVTANFNVKFLHDSERSKLVAYWAESVFRDSSSGKLFALNGVFAGEWQWGVAAKQGDWYTSTLYNIPTSAIPDSWCGQVRALFIQHWSFYGGAWHYEAPISVFSGTQGTFVNCGGNLCENKALGEPYCYDSVRVAQQWQTTNCQKTIEFLNICSSLTQKCDAGRCVSTQPTCPASTFCEGDAAVTRKVDCSKSSQTCANGCQNGVCITQLCGNAKVDSGEGCNTCPTDFQCLEGQYCDSVSNACVTPPAVELVCNDGVDDEKDGLTDCADPDCASAPNCVIIPPVDTDGDGVVDSYDNCPGSKGLMKLGLDARGCGFLQKYGWQSASAVAGTLLVFITAIILLIRRLKKK